MANQWMIYGANGYTAKLTAQLAIQAGHKPILAGRNEEKVKKAAEETNLPYKVFGLESPDAVESALSDVDAVLHMAGPFVHTSAPMVKACLSTKTHYLDITGEWNVFEAVHARTEKAKAAGVALIPGVGFDVVPSDCLAAMVAQQLPDADSLEIGIGGIGGSKNSISRGTLKSMIEGIGAGSAVRMNGKITRVSSTWKTPIIDFPVKGKRQCVTIPWGDIATAYYSTGIPNIAVYFEGKPFQLKMLDIARPILGLRFVRNMLQGWVQKNVYGPNEQERKRARSLFWAKASRKSDGASVVGTMATPEGYSLTAESSLRAVLRVLEGKVPSGSHTPSTAFGAHFVKELPGVEVFDFQKS